MKKVGSLIGLILTVIIAAILWWLLCPALSLNYFGSVIMIEIFVLALIFFIAGLVTSEESSANVGAALIVFIIFFVIDAIGLIGSTKFFQADKLYTQLANGNINNIEEVPFDKMISDIDTSQIPIVDYETAKIIATKKLGEDVTLGSRARVGDGACMEVNGEVLWVFPLEHKGFWTWNKHRTTPGYITVSASNVSHTKFYSNYTIKYSNSAYFNENMTRHLRINGCLFEGLTEYTFELMDDYTPMEVVTTYSNTGFWGAPEATGVVICNVETGEVKKYSINDVPEWVDVVQPDKFISDQINNWGEYSQGAVNWSETGKFQKTSGILTVFDNGDCYYFTGLTSKGSDRSVGRFIMVNTRTKKAKYAKLSGTTEDAAKTDAQALWADYGYDPVDPMPINVNGVPTYAFAFKSSESRLIVAYGMVNISDTTIMAKGESLKEAERAYVKKLATAGISYAASDEAFGKSMEGTVFRISNYVMDGDTYYTFMLDGHSEIFVAGNNISEELPLTEKGDQVKIYYVDDANGSFSIEEFDNVAYDTGKSENQERRDELDESHERPQDNIVDVNPEEQQSWWDSLTDEERAKIMSGENSDQ